MAPANRRNRPATGALSADAPWTLIGPGCVVHGELLMSGNVLVHGRVEGIIFTDGEVLIGREGAVDGGVHSRSIVVEGSCEGRLEATDRVLLRGGSVVRGDIEAGILMVDDGARLLGRWIRTEGGPRVQPFKDTPGHA